MRAPRWVRSAALLLALAVSALARPAQAQAPAPAPAPSPAGPAYRNLFSLNPLAIPFEYVSAEYERMASGLVSFGLAGSYFGAFSDRSYSTLEGKLRFYLNEEGPKGFSLGLGAGITRVGDNDTQFDDESFTRPTVSVLADYNWLLGKGDRFLVGAGVGTKRILGGDDVSFALVYPTFRFQIGVRY